MLKVAAYLSVYMPVVICLGYDFDELLLAQSLENVSKHHILTKIMFTICFLFMAGGK